MRRSSQALGKREQQSCYAEGRHQQHIGGKTRATRLSDTSPVVRPWQIVRQIGRVRTRRDDHGEG
jgi:hypothetical protein